jgi:integrase
MGLRITEKTIRSLKAPETGNRIYYDEQLGGFGVRVTAGGALSFVLTYWTRGRQRRHTIGRHPETNATAAREEAIRLRDEIRRGGDPLREKEQRREAPTIADLYNDYIERHAKIHLRPNTIRSAEGMARKHILPKIGRIKVADLTRRDVEELHNSVKDSPYQANRVRALLSKMMNLAKAWEWRADNPCEGIPKFREEKRERWLSTQEIERLCDALDKYSNQSVANAIRLMLLTGARKSEALTARWEDINLELGVWTKPSHHTKQKRTEHVPLSAPAIQLLASMKEQADDNAHLFPGDVAEQPLNEIKWAWAKLCKQAKIENVRIHDLRHTYASHLVSSGMSLPIVGRLLGHTQPQTTARYAHLADDPLRQATNRFASIVAAARSRKSAEIISLSRDRDA